MASENGSEPPEASGQPPVSYENEIEDYIRAVEEHHICDDDIWFSLRDKKIFPSLTPTLASAIP